MTGKTPHDAVTDLQAHTDRLSDAANRKIAELTHDVGGHRGDSAVTVTARGSGAEVTVHGPDAALVRKDVFASARATMGGPP
jgi:hypothetical protein